VVKFHKLLYSYPYLLPLYQVCDRYHFTFTNETITAVAVSTTSSVSWRVVRRLYDSYAVSDGGRTVARYNDVATVKIPASLGVDDQQVHPTNHRPYSLYHLDAYVIISLNSNKISAIAEMARVFLVNPDHGIDENPVQTMWIFYDTTTLWCPSLNPAAYFMVPHHESN